MSDPISEKGLFIIHCMDDISGEMIDKGGRFGGSAKRFSVYGEHKAYLAVTSDSNSPSFIHKIAAGPLESDDKRYMIGSFFIVEATREEAENFNRNDPFFINGVWEKVRLSDGCYYILGYLIISDCFICNVRCRSLFRDGSVLLASNQLMLL